MNNCIKCNCILRRKHDRLYCYFVGSNHYFNLNDDGSFFIEYYSKDEPLLGVYHDNNYGSSYYVKFYHGDNCFAIKPFAIKNLVYIAEKYLKLKAFI